MHILIIPSTYPTKENRAWGIFYRDQAQALQRAGHKVGVLVAPNIRPKHDLLQMRRLSDFKTVHEKFDDNGVITYQITLWSWIPAQMFHAAYNHIKFKYMLSMFLDYNQEFGTPDLIHAHTSVYGGFLGALLKERTNLPLMLTEHSTAFISNKINKKQIPYAKRALLSSDSICAVSTALRQAIIKFEPKCDVSVLGNIVNTNFFIPLPQQPAPFPFIFSSIGFLTKKKNFELLIRAFCHAFYSQNVLLRIAGDGEQRLNLQRLVQNLGLQSQVQFLGQLNRDDVKDLIQTSHAIVSTSWVETFGVTLIEALACGKPVIATRSGGPEDFINEQNGLLVPVGDEMALSNAMKQMRDNWLGYNSEAIRAQCIERYSEKAIVGQLEILYKDLLKNKSAVSKS